MFRKVLHLLIACSAFSIAGAAFCTPRGNRRIVVHLVTLLLCARTVNAILERIPRTTFANMSHQPAVTCISGGLTLVSIDTGAIVRFPVFRLSHRVVALPTSCLPSTSPTVRYTELSSDGELLARG